MGLGEQALNDGCPGVAGQRIAVTGAGGFIGSHLCRLLAKRGARVIALDRMEPTERLGDLEGRYDYIPLDLLDVSASRKTFEAARADVVFHLAAYAVQARDRDVRTAVAVNVTGSAAVVEGAANSGAGLVVQVGTSHEYGGSERPIREDHPLDPRGVYGATKAAGMLLGRARAREVGIRWLGARPFVTFGPGEDGDKLIPFVVRSALASLPIRTSTGDQVRDFVYVEDLVEGILQTSQCEAPTGTILNLGAGRGRTVESVIREVASQFAAPNLQLGTRPKRSDDVVCQIADTSAAARWIPSWTPAWDLSAGISATIESMRASSRHSD